jgi:hypothetical protein
MAFWKQTPRTFIAIMEARGRAAQRKLDQDISLAWHIMAIDRDNQKGRMKPLSKYITAIRPVRQQSADEVATIFQSLKAKGKSVKIREVKRN